MIRICISRIDKMGDMILTLPVIKSIKTNNPNSVIHVLASKTNEKILKNIKYIDKTILINSDHSILKNLIELRKIKYDYFINFSPRKKSYFFCFFSNSHNKAIIIFLSRYKRTYLSKFLLKFFSKIFCSTQLIVDRYEKLNKNQDIHQTKMMFDLVKKCKIKHDTNVLIDIDLPKRKLNFSQKKVVVLHLSEKWINKNYSEKNFIDLILSLFDKNFSVLMTTDNTTRNIFKKIFVKYKVISERDIENIKILKNQALIIDNLKYFSWLKVIYSSSFVITPECGCSHIAAACKVPVNIIYGPYNLPDAIQKEYSPWKSNYNKFIFGENNLNSKLISNIN